jgi:hypothetical protein
MNRNFMKIAVARVPRDEPPFPGQTSRSCPRIWAGVVPTESVTTKVVFTHASRTTGPLAQGRYRK